MCLVQQQSCFLYFKEEKIMDKELIKMNMLAINDCQDHMFKRKVGYLQRYVKSLGKKLYQEIQENGFFENAGQKEIRLAVDRFNKYQLDRNYQITTAIKDSICRYFEDIGEDGTIDPDWKILD